MTYTPTLEPCRTCGHRATAYRAPVGAGYLVECSNADCVSRHSAKGIASGTGTQGAAIQWNRRQGVKTA